MIYVEVFGAGAGPHEGAVLLGRLGWDGHWVADPPGSEVAHLLDQPVGGVGPDDPPRFLAALHRQYRSPYLRVGPVLG